MCDLRNKGRGDEDLTNYDQSKVRIKTEKINRKSTHLLWRKGK